MVNLKLLHRYCSTADPVYRGHWPEVTSSEVTPRRPELWEYSINLSGTDHSRFFVCPAFPVTQLWPGWGGGITHHVPEWTTYPLGWWSHRQMSRFLPIPLVCGKDWTGFCQFDQDSYCTAWRQTAVTAYFPSKQLLLFVITRRNKRR